MKFLIGFLGLLSLFSCQKQKYDVVCRTPDGYVLQLDQVTITHRGINVFEVAIPGGDKKLLMHMSNCVLIF